MRYVALTPSKISNGLPQPVSRRCVVLSAGAAQLDLGVEADAAANRHRAVAARAAVASADRAEDSRGTRDRAFVVAVVPGAAHDVHRFECRASRRGSKSPYRQSRHRCQKPGSPEARTGRAKRHPGVDAIAMQYLRSGSPFTYWLRKADADAVVAHVGLWLLWPASCRRRHYRCRRSGSSCCRPRCSS